MKSFKQELGELLAETFAACGYAGAFGDVDFSQRPDLAHFQGNGAFAAAKAAKKNPLHVAEEIAKKLGERTNAFSFAAVKPGFINICVSDKTLSERLNDMAIHPRLGAEEKNAPCKVLIDFGGPNIAKAMHVGHLRSAIIGDSLQRLFRFIGHRVTSDCHLGDWGTQMGMLLTEVRRESPDLPYFDTGFQGTYPDKAPVSLTDLEIMYPRASARCKENPEAAEEAREATLELQQGRRGYQALWRHFIDLSLPAVREDFDALGVHFDLWQGESHYQKNIPEMIRRLENNGTAVKSEGAVVVPVAEPGDKKEIPPLLLVKSDGAYLYGTTDLAALEERAAQGFEEVLYVVDKRQGLHFEQVFRAAQKSNLLKTCRPEHIAYGTVNGKDGKPFKTRAGQLMKLKDLLGLAVDEASIKMVEADVAKDYPDAEQKEIARKVGLAALKFADLMNHRLSDYLFDLEKFTSFEGKTGPYHLYTVVRIKSILKKAAESGLKVGPILPTGDSERPLALELIRLSDTLEKAAASRAPNEICEGAFRLAQTFSTFYQQHHILKEQDVARQSSWLGYADLTLKTLELYLSLLGIETPERM